MKNILMICYYFPPLVDVGCKRSVAFSKYLKKHGWSPYVISVKNPDKSYCSVGSDIPPEGVHVDYSYSIINFYKILGKLNGVLFRLLKLFHINLTKNYFHLIFLFPDLFWGWIPLTVLKSYRYIKKTPIDLIYVSCGPFSSAVIGTILKSLTKRPLVLDFRDVFGVEVLELKKLLSYPRFWKQLHYRFTKWFLAKTDLLIVVTNEMREIYIQQYPFVKDKIATIHNGFDRATLPVFNNNKKFDKFTIIYTGEFYFYALEANTFFEALHLMKEKEEISRDNFQFLFYGDGSEEITKIAKRYKVEDLVVAQKRVSYQQILENISKSHLQLIRAVKLAVPTKIYDGIALDVPFLATIKSGEAEDIIRKYSPGSCIVNGESAERITEAILDSKLKYLRGDIQANRVEDFLKDFSRESYPETKEAD